MKIQITNDLKHIRSVYDRISEYCQQNNIDDTTKFNLNLIVEEYITNIINHGSIEPNVHDIQIEVEQKGDKIYTKITDDATEFNPLEAELPDIDKKIKEKQPGGLGVFLILQKAENIKYYRKNNRNNFEFLLTTNVEK
jgi:anti-sigma regulatory factor (Ser/Thr protein kinase)